VTIPVTVKNLIRPNIVSLDARSSVKAAAELMVSKNVGSVLVTDGSHQYVGIVTERDLLKKVTATGQNPAQIWLEDIMSRPLITIDAKSGLGEATSLMIERNIRRLLVVENEKVIGIFTQRDLQQKIIEVFRSLAESQSFA
jgi:CBS domain-containing protein